MRERDEFDSPDFKSAVGSIFQALDRRDSVEPRKPVWAAAIVLSLVVFLASVLVYSYPRKSADPDDVAVPLIRADAGPVKVAPTDPGGMDIPYRDSTVFETLHAENAGGAPVENLLDDTEEPVSRDELFAGIKAEVRVEGREVVSAPELEKAVPDAEVKVAEAPQEAVEKAAPKLAAIPAVVSGIQAESEKAVAAAVSKAEPAAGVETFQSGEAGKGGYFTQLASVRSADAAEKAWLDLQKTTPALQASGHRIKTADLAERGMYYRVQAGPFTQDRAREVCAAIEAKRPGGCLVVKD